MIPQNLLIAFSLIGLVACRQEQKTTAPKVKKLTEAVYASGNLIPEREYKVVPATDGYLSNVLVDEGDSVSRGELLFVLTNADKDAGVSSAVLLARKTKALANPASPVIKQLQSSLAIANSRVSNDSLQYGRFKKLYEQNAVAQSTYEKWEQQYHNAQNERAAILQQINAQQLSLNLQLQQATNQVRLSVTERNNGNLTCLEDGKVYELYKHTGDHVNPNEAIALIGSHKIIARLSVDEDDYGMIKTGQKVVIKADAFPDKTFDARITKIYPLLNKAEQSFRADAELVEDCPGSLYGLNIEANIIITENQPVLVIPKETLLKGDSVLIKENNKLVKVKITKGIEDKNWVQVKTGLTGKNSIILP